MIEIIEEENAIEYIADLYGLFNQELQLIQEMSELTQAITKTMLCINTESLKGNVDEEIADVEIMLEQVKYLRGECGYCRADKISENRQAIEKN